MQEVILVETDIKKIKRLSKEKEYENTEFRLFLKQCRTPPEEIDSIVHRLYQQIASEIDCQACANCCKELIHVLDEEDIKELSKGLNIPVDQFKEQYLVKDEQPGYYNFNKQPCPLLVNNSCSCWEYRPKNCRSYPHLHKDEFVSRTINVVQNCSVCPIVFNTYERLKGELWSYHFDDFDDFDFDDVEDFDNI
jgi:Fe-S-cluster containining protein